MYLSTTFFESGAASSGNRPKYNGKLQRSGSPGKPSGEQQDASLNGVQLGWYDYGARFYDPTIARWSAHDPLAEKNRRWSPFAYAYNNPIRFIDPDGRYAVDYDFGDERDKPYAHVFLANLYVWWGMDDYDSSYTFPANEGKKRDLIPNERHNMYSAGGGEGKKSGESPKTPNADKKKETPGEQFDRLKADVMKDPNASWFTKHIVFSPVGKVINQVGVPVLDFLLGPASNFQSPTKKTVSDYIDSKIDSTDINQQNKLIIKSYKDIQLEKQ